MQTGIGAIPNIVAQLLAQGTKGDFGIHTEMMVDGIMHLHQAGKITNHKGVYDGFSVATFAAGSKALYQWMDQNPEVRLLPVAQVNDPAIIRRNRKMVSINGALAVDLCGQVMADTSGRGSIRASVATSCSSSAPTTARTARASSACMRRRRVARTTRLHHRRELAAWAHRSSTPRHHVQYIITEHGTANLGMLTDVGRARALAEIADPEFRDELRELRVSSGSHSAACGASSDPMRYICRKCGESFAVRPPSGTCRVCDAPLVVESVHTRSRAAR